MTTKNDIANLALSLLTHHQMVADVDTDQTTLANTVRKFFDQARREVLGEHNWRFATVIRYSQGVAGITAKDKYRHSLVGAPGVPVLRFISIHPYPDAPSPDNELHWETGHLGEAVLGHEEVWLKYVHDSTEYNLYPPRLITALGYRLGFHIALPITKSTRAKSAMLEGYMDSIARAIEADYSGSPPERFTWVSDSTQMQTVRERGIY